MPSSRSATPPPLPLPPAGLAGQLSFAFYWAHHFVAPAGWVVPPPECRPYATLWLITDGQLEIGTVSGPERCGPGTLVVWPPESERPAANRSGAPATLYTAAFNLQVWGELDFFRVYRVPTLHAVTQTDALSEPFAALVAELAAHNDAVTLVAEGWARVLVGRWLAALQAAGQLTPAAGVDERLTSVLAAIETDLAGEWSLQRLADTMRLSKVRMRELFVNGVGLPPMRYIALQRLAHARRLLHDTDLTSAEISERCGFQDPAYFSRLFHRHSGLQPRTYREQARFRRE